MPTEYRIDVYDATGVTQLGTFAPHDLLDPTTITREENGVYSLSLNCKRSSSAYLAIPRRGQIWVAKIGSASPQKFRVVSKENQWEPSSGLRGVVEAEHIGMDLAMEVIADSTGYSYNTLEDLVDLILTGSAFTKGTIDAALGEREIPDFIVGGQTRLDMLNQLREKVGGVLRVNDDKTVDILERKALTGTPSAIIHARKNLIDSIDREDVSEYVSRLYGIGGGDPRMSLKGTWHTLAPNVAVSTTTIKAFQIAHSTGTFVATAGRNYFIEYREQAAIHGSGVALHQITAFDPNNDSQGRDEITYTENGSYPIAGDVGSHEAHFRLWWEDPVGAPGVYNLVDALEDHAAYTDLGAWVDGISDHGDLEPVDNLAIDAFLSGKYGTIPPIENAFPISIIGFGGHLGQVLEPNTDRTFILNGSKSQKVTLQADEPREGIKTIFDMGLALDGQRHFSIKLQIYLVSGRLEIAITEGDVPNPYDADDGGLGTIFEPEQRVVLTQVGWHTVRFEGFNNDLGNRGGIWYWHEGGTTDTVFYLDSYQIEAKASASDVWTKTSTKRELWTRVYGEMARRLEPRATYSSKIRDLSEEDPSRYPHDIFDTSDVIHLLNPEISLDDKLWVNRYIRDLLDPGNTTIDIKTHSEQVQDIQGQTLVKLERTEKRLGSVVAKAEKQRALRSDTRKIVTASPDLLIGENYQSMGRPIGGGGIVWAGMAAHGIPFLGQLTVPTDKKVVILFHPTRSASVEGGAGTSDGFPYYFGNETEQMNLTLAAFASLVDGRGFSIEDPAWNRIKHIKWFLTQLGASDYESTPASLNRDRSTAWDVWIPPGTYKDLMLFAYAEPAIGADAVIYAGSLLLVEVPLFRAILNSSVLAGASSFTISAYPVGASGAQFQQIPPFGKVVIGEGASQETITYERLQSASYDPSIRTLKSSTFANAHDAGEKVVEAQAGT